MVAAALVAGAQAMMAPWVQTIAAAAFGCFGVGDGSSDDTRIVKPEAADRIQDEWRSTLPHSGTTWLLLARPSPQPPAQSRSGCQTVGGDDGG
jgi:hypothetical protein